MRNKLIQILLLASCTAANAQFSDTYQKAARAYENAASQCQSPAGASCMRQNATYYSCLAHQLQGGGSCGSQPSCSTSCTSSGSASGLSGSGTSAGLSQKQQLALTGLNLALTWFSNHHKDKDEPTPQTAEEEAADAAQREAHEAAAEAAIAQADQASSDLANMRTALTSGADPSTLGALSGQASSDPNIALRNQLTAGDSTTAAAPQQIASNDPSDQMAQLRAQMTAQVEPQAEPDPLISSITQNPQFISAYTLVQDPPPDSSQIGTLDDLTGDKPIDPSAADVWEGMKKTASSWANSAGDLFKSHPLQSIAQSLGLSQDPNADPVQSAVHNCGVSMLAGAAPHPAGGVAAAAGCMNSVQQQGMGVVGMASDQMETQ